MIRTFDPSSTEYKILQVHAQTAKSKPWLLRFLTLVSNMKGRNKIKKIESPPWKTTQCVQIEQFYAETKQRISSTKFEQKHSYFSENLKPHANGCKIVGK